MPRVNLLKLSAILAYLSLLGSVVFVSGEAPPFSLFLFAGAFITGLALDRSSFHHPVFSRAVVGLAVAGIILLIVGIRHDAFFTRALSVLLVLTSAKLLLPKKPGDILQIYLLNLLVVAAGAVTRWGIEFGLLVILEAFISVTGLVFLFACDEHQDMPAGHIWPLIRWSGLITAAMIPATVIFFLVLPRPSGIFFAWRAGSAARTGFTDRVSPGAVQEILTDSSPAFRVKWIRGKRPRRPLWRGIIYDTYEQGTWVRRYKRGVKDIPGTRARALVYEVLLEPTASRNLLSLGLPVRVQMRAGGASCVTGYTLRSHIPIQRRTLYRVLAYDTGAIPADLPPTFYLQIPAKIRDALTPLASGLAGKQVSQTARSVESFLKSRFSYTDSPGKVEGDPTLYFLFHSKAGHCEYFASAMVLLLRTLGIPSRVVGGYAGGEWNEMGRYYLVRNSDAHTWVEVWIQGRGWVPFDPTPGLPSGNTQGPMRWIYRFIDYLRVKWYYGVLSYDVDRQMDLVRRTASFLHSLESGVQMTHFHLKTPNPYVTSSFIIIAGLALGLWMLRAHVRKRPRTWGERFVHLLRKYGYARRPEETLLEFSRRIKREDPLVGRQAQAFVVGYYRFEYGRQGEEETLREGLEALSRGLKARRA